MTSHRYKSAPYRRRQLRAFAVIGEAMPVMTRYVLRVWPYEDDDPVGFSCSSLESVAREKARIIQGDMELFEAYASTAPLAGDDDPKC